LNHRYKKLVSKYESYLSKTETERKWEEGTIPLKAGSRRKMDGCKVFVFRSEFTLQRVFRQRSAAEKQTKV
jgi:hypothetical protein